MIGSLTAIQQHLESLGRARLLDLLAPGTGRARTRLMLGELGLESRPEIEDLYAWHDGTETSPSAALGDIALFPGFYLLNLTDACTNYRAFAPDARWTQGWFPVFADGGGDFHVVDLRPQAGGVVRHFMIDQDNHPIVFESIVRMVETIASAYDAGTIYVGDDGYLTVNDEAFARLARTHNPSVAWWAA